MEWAYEALDKELKAWNYKPEAHHTGSYNCRPITGGTNYSLHAYRDNGTFIFWTGVKVTMALAVDINWQRNPYGPRLVTDMPRGMVDAILAIRTNNGKQVWGWGGYYSGNKDAMHFEIVCSPADLATGIRSSSSSAPTPTPTPTPVEEDDMPEEIIWLETPEGNAAYIKNGRHCIWLDIDNLSLCRFFGTKENSTPLEKKWQSSLVVVNGPARNTFPQRIEEWGLHLSNALTQILAKPAGGGGGVPPTPDQIADAVIAKLKATL